MGFIFWISPALLRCQTFPCNEQLYLFLPDSDSEFTSIQGLDVDTNNGEADFTEILNTEGQRFSCIAYSTRDQYIYALDRDNYHLYRITTDGPIDLGIPNGLDTVNYIYHAGTFSPSGIRFYVVGRSKNGNTDKVLSTIRFDTPDYSVGSLAILGAGVRLSDLAYDPVYGSLYGFDELNKQLITLSGFSGIITNYDSPTLHEIAGMSALFFDERGVLYGYGSTGGEQNTLFEFNKFEREVARKSFGPNGGDTDGCSCPYRLDFRRRFDQNRVLPCSEVTLTYDFISNLGSSYTQTILRDTLPEGFTITEIVKGPGYGQIESGIGSNIFEVTDMDLLLQDDSIVLKIAIDETVAPGIYAQQAWLSRLPQALSADLYSDDPQTAAPDDPTSIEVLDATNILLDEQIVLCADTVLLLDAGFGGDNYLWSDGSTENTLEVSSDGWYWVEVENDCVRFRDSILVEAQAVPLNVTLEADDELDAGVASLLSFTSNATTTLSLEWQVNNGGALSCTDCNQPNVILTNDAVVQLYAEDAFGCGAYDSRALRVRNELLLFAPNIFTPNFDGNNDYFFLQGRANFLLRRLQIFDRWGSQVYQAVGSQLNDRGHGWDGEFKGQPAGEGVYIWLAEIELPNGEVVLRNGDFTLIRP